MFRSLDYGKDKVHLIVNRHDKGGEIRLQDLEAAYGTAIYRTVPNHYEVGGRLGQPGRADAAAAQDQPDHAGAAGIRRQPGGRSGRRRAGRAGWTRVLRRA